MRHVLLLLITCLIAALPAHAAQKIQGLAPGQPVVIGIAVPVFEEDEQIVRGAQLAADRINETGGISGHPIRLVIERAIPPRDGGLTDRIAADTGRDLAIRMIEHNPIAVIGHDYSDGAVAASQIYQDAGVLFLATFATDDSLTQHSFDLTFRVTIPIRYSSRALAHHAFEQKYCNLLMFAERSHFGREKSLMLKQLIEDYGSQIVLSASFEDNTEDFQDILLYVQDNKVFSTSEIDAIIFLGSPLHAGDFIAQARRIGIKQPILGSPTLQSPHTIEVAGDAMQDIVTYSLFDQTDRPDSWGRFAKNFENRYGSPPSDWSALSFDSIGLLANTIADAETVLQQQLARHLHSLAHIAPYKGVTGKIAFNLHGEIINREINLISYQDGKFAAITDWSGVDGEGSNDRASPLNC
jgi:branched-chain amino acid transport system substrate-binding protein